MLSREFETVVKAAISVYKERCPDGQEMNASEWCDLWHDVCQPFELALRSEMRKSGCNIEKWVFMEN